MNTYHEYRSNFLHTDRIASKSPTSLWFTGRPEFFIDRDGKEVYIKRATEEDILKKLRSYSFLGVKYIVLPPGFDLNRAAKETSLKTGRQYPYFPLIYRNKDAVIFENPEALPRAFIAGKTKYASSFGEAQAAINSDGFDIRREVVLEEQAPSGFKTAENTCNCPYTADIVEYSTNRVEIKAYSDNGGITVLTDVFYPGWKAYVDGKPAKIYRVDGLVRGVFIEKGEHRIVFKYLPQSFTARALISAISLIAVLAAGLLNQSDPGKVG